MSESDTAGLPIPVPGIGGAQAPADAASVDEARADLRIGDFVTWRGRLCVLRGTDPMSVAHRRAELEECASGERLRVPLDELAAPPDPGGQAGVRRRGPGLH